MLAKPVAPARAQSQASSLMSRMSSMLEGCAPSKMQAFRCFQRSHAVRMMMVPIPLHKPLGVLSMESDHQVKKAVDPSGGVVVIRHQDRTSCHEILEKLQPTRR